MLLYTHTMEYSGGNFTVEEFLHEKFVRGSDYTRPRENHSVNCGLWVIMSM